MKFDDTFKVSRWVAYFDLLGFRARAAAVNVGAALGQISEAIYWCRQIDGWSESLKSVWFSDTFLIVAQDDSAESFWAIETASRRFASLLLGARIPLRGAISCDLLYADFEERVFVGKALVEAYDYGEGQDWIGLILCPSASNRLHSLNVAPPPVHYKSHKIDWTIQEMKERRPKGAPDELTACLIGNHSDSCGENSCIFHLETMLKGSETMPEGIQKENVRRKYERTIDFLRANPRVIPDELRSVSSKDSEGPDV
ncbi:MAG: hypothetical protein ABI824_17495 [Acidobacteriota bacterium]